jgi:DNA repair protein RecN (Recombination protein N)
MHSQHEHQSLFIVENHRKLLDRFGGLEREAMDFYEIFQSLNLMRKELNSLLESEDDHLQLVKKLKGEIDEIDESHLEPGEEEALEKDIKILARQEDIFGSLNDFRNLISEGRGGALSKLREAGSMLDNIAEIDDSLVPLHKRFENTFLELEDLVDSLRSYQLQFEIDPSELGIKEDRLALISDLEKKYGLTIQDVLKHSDTCKASLAVLEDDEFNIEELKKKITILGDKVKSAALSLSGKRAAAAIELQGRIEQNLQELGMKSARFVVDLNRKRSTSGNAVYGPWGIDSIEFLLSANSGEPEKPLRSVASGGEISRVMLALKTVLADSDDVSSLVFDEIDSGIGGEVALAVGAHMRDLARYKQVLSITHLASIAVFADNHIIVKKNIVDERTVTSVSNIEEEERTREIARMLSGDRDGSASISHAEEMLRTYGSV